MLWFVVRKRSSLVFTLLKFSMTSNCLLAQAGKTNFFVVAVIVVAAADVFAAIVVAEILLLLLLCLWLLRW